VQLLAHKLIVLLVLHAVWLFPELEANTQKKYLDRRNQRPIIVIHALVNSCSCVRNILYSSVLISTFQADVFLQLILNVLGEQRVFIAGIVMSSIGGSVAG